MVGWFDRSPRRDFADFLTGSLALVDSKASSLEMSMDSTLLVWWRRRVGSSDVDMTVFELELGDWMCDMGVLESCIFWARLLVLNMKFNFGVDRVVVPMGSAGLDKFAD